MKETKQDRETRNIELVETGNIAKSLRRINAAPGHYIESQTWRAVYHAFAMAGASRATLQRLPRGSGVAVMNTTIAGVKCRIVKEGA